MGVYRVYELPLSDVPFKHVYLRRGLLKPDRVGDSEQKENVVNEKKLEANISRARRNAIDIALSNEFEYFTTCEFRGETHDRYDVSICQKKISKFFHNFKARYAPDFIYLMVPEYHPKTGAVHMHGMIGGIPEGEFRTPETIPWRNTITGEVQEIPNTRGVVRWDRYQKALGFFDCSKIRNHSHVAYYLSKYMSKDLISLPKGVKTFISSINLKRPKLVIDTPSDGLGFNASFENNWCKIKYDTCGDTYELAEKSGNIDPFNGGILRECDIEEASFFDDLKKWAEGIDGSLAERYNEESEVEYENLTFYK